MVGTRLTENFSSKVRLGFSPYTYARVAVMKSALFKKQDYDRIMKMGANEAIRFLQDTQYRQEMDNFDVSAEGIKTIEAALNANLMRNFQKLYSISDSNMQKTLAVYLLRYDLENIKMILRSKFANVKAEEIEPLLYNSVNFSKEFMGQLLSKSSMEEVVNSLKFLKFKKAGTLSSGSGINNSNLFAVENGLDQYYFTTLHNFAQSLTGQGKIVSKFLQQEIVMANIKTIIKLNSQPSTLLSQHLQEYLIQPSRFELKLSHLNNLTEIVKMLNKHKLTTLNGEEKDLLMKLEIDLDVSLLKKENLLLHQSLLSANYILGYLFAKEIEVRNLKALIKGKKLKVDEAYLEQLLVVAK